MSSQNDVTRPIEIILDGTNYSLWSSTMTLFLKGRKLWRYVSGELTKPEKGSSESTTEYATRLEEWESVHCKILSWFINTSVLSIHSLLPKLGNAKVAWDLLASRYNCTNDASLQFQIETKLYQMRQEVGQSIADFYSLVANLWDQLAAAEPQFHCTTDTKLFADYRDRRKFMHFMMALRDDFESTRASLLHRTPLPTLDSAVAELISEENRRSTMKMQSTEIVMAAAPRSSSTYSSTQPQSSTKGPFCRYCKKGGHMIQDCRTLQRKKSRESRGHPQQTVAATTGDSFAHESSPQTTSLSTAEIETLIHQVLSRSSSALSVTSGKSSWFIDSACCNHMTHDPTLFSSKIALNPNHTIYTADGSHISVSHTGPISTPNLTVDSAYLVPKLSLNLLSVGQLCDLGFELHFSNRGCDVQDPRTGQLIGTGRKMGRLFELDHLQIPSTESSSFAAPAISSSIWHCRLGHTSLPRIHSLASSGHLGSVDFTKFDCLSCQLGKQTHLPFNTSDSFSSASFDLIHSDIWGPAPIPTEGGSRYFVIFVDDYSRYTWIYLMHKRSELFNIYKHFHQMVQTQFSRTIKIFRSDNAMEYNEKSFLEFLQQNGTISHRSCPHTSQQNGRAERKHRHILDTVRSLLISASLPERFWGEAALTAVYTINRVPSPTIHNKTPFELLYGKNPDYSSLRVFGCVCFVLLPPHERTKLEPRSRQCCFLGYGIEQKGYRCYDPVTKRLRLSRHVDFWEHKLFTSVSSFPSIHTSHSPVFTDPSITLFPESTDLSAGNTSSSNGLSLANPNTSDAPVDHPPTSHASEPSQTPDPSPDVEPRRSSRVSVLPAHLRDYHCFSALSSLHEPRNYREAQIDPLWRNAMSEELDALSKTHTWDLVDLPPGKSVVDCMWTYKVKTHADGSFERRKARLVAKGFTQEYGIDYEETFAPVARLTSVRSLIAVAAVRHWQLLQMDVKNAFLNGDLTEEIYMKPPPGFEHPPNKVCRLRRALYGLKQAPRAWFAKFSSVIAQQGFTPSSYDSALFLRKTDAGTILVLLYVDDMIITGDDSTGIRALQDFLGQQFEMKDLGTLHYFLGLEVTSSSDGYYLSQAKYASDLISRAGLTDSKTASTPLEYNARLNPMDGVPLSDVTLYRQLVGSLIYLTVTRPDIVHAVHMVSQFMHQPRSPHYAAVLRILRYIKGTLFHGLYYSSHSSLDLCAYSDADWAGDLTDRRSTTGYCFLLGSSLISWRSKKQTSVARSTTEAEYRALADTTSELLWLRRLLTDMGAPQFSSSPLHCDNQSAIQIAHNDVFHERTKHIEIDCHFIRQHLTDGTLHLRSVSSADQLADIFTKSHPPGRLHELASKLKLVSTSPP